MSHCRTEASPDDHGMQIGPRVNADRRAAAVRASYNSSGQMVSVNAVAKRCSI